MKIDSSISNYYFSERHPSKNGANAYNDATDQQPQRRSANSVAPASSSASLSSALWLAQPGNAKPAISDSFNDTTTGSDVIDEFLKWSDMSLPEKIRAQYLEDHNLTEEILQQLPMAEREKIEEEIRKAIFAQLGVDEKDGEAATSVPEPAVI